MRLQYIGHRWYAARRPKNIRRVCLGKYVAQNRVVMESGRCGYEEMPDRVRAGYTTVRFEKYQAENVYQPAQFQFRNIVVVIL